MKKPEDQLKLVNPEADSVSGELGITDDRRDAIVKRTDEIVKKEMEDANGNKANALVNIYNEFENPVECAFALFIMSHEGEKLAVSALFGGMPEVVA